MFPFVKVRKTKSNHSLAKEGGEEAFDKDQYEDEQNNEDKNNKDESNEGYNDEDQYEANELENSLKKTTEEIAEKQDTPFLMIFYERRSRCSIILIVNKFTLHMFAYVLQFGTMGAIVKRKRYFQRGCYFQ